MKFYIYTLGCKVNTYESNVMMDHLINAGYIKAEEIKDADIIIINTCSVTNVADNKSMKMIHHAKNNNPNAIIVVCGCLVQNKQQELQKENVNIILGNIGKSKIVEYLNNFIKNKNNIYDVHDIMDTSFEEMKLNNFDKTRAFVKIQDGCNNFCSYCIIPYTRGNARSKKREEVLSEINNLLNQGHKEIVLTGIHTGNYGAEFDNYHLSNLLSEIVKIKGLERLRISSIEMNEINSEVLEIMKKKQYYC